MRTRLLAGAAAIAIGAAGATGAQAQDWLSGWYLGADVGYAWSEGIDGESNVNSSNGRPYSWTFENEDDVVGFGRLGYRFNPNWRVELEGGYRKSDIESILGDASDAQPVGLCAAGIARTVAAPTCQPPVNAEMRVGTAMFNVLYDFDMGYALKPFIGLGVGWAEVHTKAYGQLSGVPAGGARFQNTNFDDIDGAFAGQAIIGLTYELSPNWAVDFTGRYLRTADLEFGSNTMNVTGIPGGTITDVGTFEGNYEETSATIGIRYTFAAPPPPPPPPPPMAAPPPPPPPATQTCPDGSVILATEMCPVAPPPPPPPPVEPVRG